MENQMTSYNLSDKAIVRIVDLLQLALLTGTDIVDNLRTLRLTLDGEKLTISEADNEAFVAGVQRLQEQAAKLAADRNGTFDAD